MTDRITDRLDVDPDEVQVVGDGDYWSWCPTCYRQGHPPGADEDDDVVLYFTDERWRAKMESRDHREWHPDHRPIARGPDDERVYG